MPRSPESRLRRSSRPVTPTAVESPIVCDSSALVAVLLDGGPDGRWATEAVAQRPLAAPSLISFETANIIRRLELAGAISSDQSAQAHRDLLGLDIELWPYDLLAGRAWELRRNLTLYDASYVALAELLGGELVTLDKRIGGAPGLRCSVLSPP
jgi:predicted nucleic acid-binding protein